MPQRLLLEGSDIDELLLRVQAEHGPQARIVHAEEKLVGGVAGFLARRRYELAVQVDDAPAETVTPSAATPEPAQSFEQLLARADGADGSPDVATRPAAPTPTNAVPTQRGRRLSTDSPQFEDLLSTLMGRAERDPRAGADAATPGRAATSMPAPEPTAPTSEGPATTALRRLGLPADRVPRHPAADPRTALLDVLAALPAAPNGRLWGTTVVVGPASLAHRVVESIVEHTGGSGVEPLVTTSSAPSAADIAVRASASCATHGAAIVVIETPATRAGARRAGKLVAGLGLGSVVAAVDATRDVTATSEWLAELAGAGRLVDQLAASDVAESPTPLALLGLGPQVGWVDGRPATVGSWAAPCLDRLLTGEA